EAARRERLARLVPNDMGTWQFAGRVEYARSLENHPFSADDVAVLDRVAEGVGVRESRPQLHTPLHVHLAGGSGGASFVFLVDENGEVFPLVYAVSTSRSGNAYRWFGAGSSYMNGPPPIGPAIREHPAFGTSERVVASGSDAVAAAEQRGSGAVPVRPGPEARSGDPDAVLRAAIGDYFQAKRAFDELASASTSAAPAAGSKKTKKKKAKSGLAQAQPDDGRIEDAQGLRTEREQRLQDARRKLEDLGVRLDNPETDPR
ncbi:hypothetical protein AB0J84_08400, partial [Micromonospora arborensis]|uniref:hypothetical protein n=1 Tax=Micromonospora arborensis TaxID=2116518 RepID=UPI003428C23D